MNILMKIYDKFTKYMTKTMFKIKTERNNLVKMQVPKYLIV